MTRFAALALIGTLALGAASCNQTAEPPVAGASSEIAWRQGDVEDALAEAKETGKPVLLYWGAVWCPPCAQMKSTLFKDPAFIAKTQDFIPVYLDGDTEGAQKWGEHFGASGYPTVIALSPDGKEITRLSSATMASELPALLTLAAGRTRTIDAVLADARKDPKGLSAEDWKILAAFDWGNDPKRFENVDLGELLAKLAAAAPDPALQRRFTLDAIGFAAESDKDDNLVLTPAQAAQVAAILPRVLASPVEVEAGESLLIYSAADLVSALPKGAERDALTTSLDATLARLHADRANSLLDRTFALRSRVALAEGTGTIGDPLKQEVRAWVATVDREAKDEFARKAVISYAAGALDMIGDRAGARKLLTAEATNSRSGYYYMSILSDMAAEDKDAKGAVEWARKAYEASQGPATRVQWAANYAMTVMEQTPKDKAAVAASADAVLAELGKSDNSYFMRTRTSVERWGKAMAEWSAKNGGAEVLKATQGKLATVCARQGNDARACGAAIKTA
ncbi:thioredoxin family protein [Croceicoccus sp. BE223]|uniref:thioredoxin family protein n=1 Tax=Croceicoccus sp. BE223 TaxID=2817716 RepID=UPI0028634E9F|nr:thioredoxin family protein [Croceicoccus sp. BE223]MDR7102703.1 protein disulfide-isomerase [Croceicoccus sp. BE223]